MTVFESVINTSRGYHVLVCCVLRIYVVVLFDGYKAL